MWRAGDDILGHFGRYPVLMLSFKDIKAATWADCRAGVAHLIAAQCQRHLATVATSLDPVERAAIDQLRMGDADNATLGASLSLLSRVVGTDPKPAIFWQLTQHKMPASRTGSELRNIVGSLFERAGG